MSMNTTRLTDYWNAEEAHTVIEFLDILRDELWEVYGEQIIAMTIQADDDDYEQAERLSSQYCINFDNDDPF